MAEQTAAQSIGKYEILGTLGRGSMGVVYKGRDPEIGREVAIKTLRRITSANFTDAESALERFKVEARSAGNLRHPNIITIFDVNVDGDTPYIVMDYVVGESLDAVLAREERFDVATALRYLEQIGAGLDAAHQAGVIHRDIKPSNLIVDKNGTVYILDFGVARINESFSESEKVVRPEPVMGTPGYMSPEQILNESLDARSDLFSLAIVAFEFFTGKRPFEGNNFTEIVGNILNRKEISLTSLVPDLPIALEEEFERALAKKKTKRFGSAAEMVGAFKRAGGMGLDGLPVVGEGITSSQSSAGAPGGGRVRKPSEWRSLSDDLSSGGASSKPNSTEGLYDNLRKGPTVPLGNGPPRKPSVAGAWASSEAQQQRLRDLGGVGLSEKAEQREMTPGELFRNADTLARAPVVKRASPVRSVLTALIGGMCIVLAFYFYFGSDKPSPRSGPIKVTSAKPKQERLPQSIPRMNTQPLPKAEAVEIPDDKTIQELNDKQLLSVLIKGEASDTEILEALKEAHSRKISNLIEAAVYPLDSDSYVVRIETLKLLSEIGDKRIVPKLVEILDDHDPLVRAYAADTIGKLGSRAALSYLSARYQREKVERVRASLKSAIENIRGYPLLE